MSFKSMLNGLLVLHILLSVMNIYIGYASMYEDLFMTITSFGLGGLFLISGILLRMRQKTGVYLTSILGAIVVLRSVVGILVMFPSGLREIVNTLTMGSIDIILGLILVSVYFNKAIKNEIMTA